MSERPMESSATEAGDHLEENQRLHPMTLLQRLIVTLPGLALLVVPLLSGRDPRAWLYVFMLVLYSFVAVPLIILHYVRFRFRISARELHIESGVFTRRRRSIPIERIQNVQIERPVLARLSGTAKVRVETAGGQGAEGVLELVSLETAHKIRDTIRTFQRIMREEIGERSAHATEPRDVRDDAEPSQPERDERDAHEVYRMDLARVLLSGVFRFSLVYIAVVFSGLEYLRVEPVEILEWFERGELGPIAEFARSSPWLTVGASVVAAALFAWITGILVNLNRFFRFRLQLDRHKLYKQHGLLTLSESAVPMRRIQALVLHTNPLMKRFDWWHLSVQTLGVESAARGRTMVVPFARLHEALGVCAVFEPFALPDTFMSVSPLTVRRRFLRYAAVLLPGAWLASLVWHPALWGAAALPLLLGVAFLQFRNHGYALSERHLFVRSGVIHHRIWVLPRRKFQAFFATSSIFQRRLGLQTLHVDTAGAPTVRYPRIIDLPATESNRRFHELSGYGDLERELPAVPTAAI